MRLQNENDIIPTTSGLRSPSVIIQTYFRQKMVYLNTSMVARDEEFLSVFNHVVEAAGSCEHSSSSSFHSACWAVELTSNQVPLMRDHGWGRLLQGYTLLLCFLNHFTPVISL